MHLMKSMEICSSGLSANRTKMNIIAENLANTETTRTDEGGPYKRKMAVFRAQQLDPFKHQLRELYEGVKVDEVVTFQDDIRLIHNPAHPDADPETGYVAMPNINPLTEMADLMVARRAYDANITVITTTKSLITKALEIGR